MLVGKRYDSEEFLALCRNETNKQIADYHHSDEENHTEALQRAQKFLRLLEARKRMMFWS